MKKLYIDILINLHVLGFAESEKAFLGEKVNEWETVPKIRRATEDMKFDLVFDIFATIVNLFQVLEQMRQSEKVF